MQIKSCFIIGLPGAGKTTYLAALAYSLQQKKIKTQLQWPTYKDNHQYLINLSNEWLQAKPVARTSLVNQQETIKLDLVDQNDNACSVTFPDLSGETFQRWYIDREISTQYADAIIDSVGVLVFINPATVRLPEFISNIPSELRLDNDETNQLRQRDPINDDPSGVILVELLQFVAELRDYKQVKLTIVISAWDIISSDFQQPEKYIVNKLPLLWQYLVSNQLLFDTTYFGVSAQGDALENEEKRKELLNRFQKSHAERICVYDNHGNLSHDITLPLWSAMNS